MTEQQLWKFFWDKKIAFRRPFNKYMLYVRPQDFESVKNLFRQEYNLFHSGKNYRSQEYFRNIHAVDKGKYFCLHEDFGNWHKLFPLGAILHLFADVLPFELIHLLRGVKVEDVEHLPKPR